MAGQEGIRRPNQEQLNAAARAIASTDQGLIDKHLAAAVDEQQQEDRLNRSFEN